ncbi:MAG: DUF3048 C-terminal domain-containing protein, partial [Gemmataceae bacterium]|nr:DUF3048 C-terminal domain-containing protein [Gemmataceae bacterium]
KVRDLDAFLPGSDRAYFRTDDRYAPQNLVTGTAALRLAAAAQGNDGPPAVESWPFKEDGVGASSWGRAGGIEVNFTERRQAAGVVQWHWDPSVHAYLRFQSGGPHLDGLTKQQLAFKTVVVMRVPYEAVDFAGHVVLDQYGEGPATVFLDGRQVQGTWRKKDRQARTRFFDATGAEIAFNRGPVFIEVVGPRSLVTTAEDVAALPPMPRYEQPRAPQPSAEDEDAPPPRAAPTATPTGSPGPSPTGSPSPGATAVSPASPSASPGPGGTATTPATATGTPSGSPGATPSGTAAPSATSAPSATASPAPTGATSAPASPSPAASGTSASASATQPASSSTPG